MTGASAIGSAVLAASPALDLERQAAEVAQILSCVANARRLRIICQLVESQEATVNSLAEAVGLSQSAASQHLARMREEGILTFRRQGKLIWYRIADPRVAELFGELHRIFCRF